MSPKLNRADDPNTSFGVFLHQRRKELGLTLVGLKERLLLGRRKRIQISSWEDGSAFPDPELLPKLAEVLNVPLDQLAVGYLSSRVRMDVVTRFAEVQAYLPEGFATPPVKLVRELGAADSS